MGLCEGCPIKVVQKYPFHGPVIIESHHQRFGLRYTVFTMLTGQNKMTTVALIGNPNTGKTTIV